MRIYVLEFGLKNDTKLRFDVKDTFCDTVLRWRKYEQNLAWLRLYFIQHEYS